MLDGPGFEARQPQEIFSSFEVKDSSEAPQPSIQWVSKFFLEGRKAGKRI